MIDVSSAFSTAQASLNAMPYYQVCLAFGDYAQSINGATAAASGTPVTDYPASGAIDGDRTELNIGAAATADNGVGQGSWKSSARPDGSGNVWLVVDFGQSRTFTRTKLYNMAADCLTSYLLQYWDGAAWQDYAGTPDKFSNSQPGYGQGGYGSTEPYGDPSHGNWPGLGYTGQLDAYDTTTPITSTKIRLVVYSTHSGGAAQVVALEVYRVIDITSRVQVINGPERKKDFKLAQPIASQEVVSCDNSDQFFSISYTPTAAQVAAGYVNAEIAQLGFDLEVNEGFYTSAGVQLIRTFTGSVDSITPTAGSALAEIVARDYTKHLINNQDSCRLKTNIDIASAVQYALNRCNISNYEMTLPTTNIVIPYFFYYEDSVLTVIQELVQAAGDAIFFFDEYGIATFQYFLTATPQQERYENQAEWLSGTLSNLDAYSSNPNILGPYQLFDNFADNLYSGRTDAWLPEWTIEASIGGGSVDASTGALVINSYYTTSAPRRLIDAPFTQSTGFVRFTCQFQYTSGEGLSTGSSWVMFQMTQAFGGGFGTAKGYGIAWYYPQRFKLVRFDGGAMNSGTVLADLGASDTGTHVWGVIRDSSGNMTILKDGASVGTATDNTYTTCSNFGVAVLGSTYAGATITIDDIFFNSNTTTIEGDWTSPIINRGVALNANGIFQANIDAPAGVTVTCYTAGSTDGVNFEGWIVATPGVIDPCSVWQYERIKVVFSCATSYIGSQAFLYTIVVNWYTGSGQQKWSPSVNFYLTDQNGICEVQQQVSDSLGGDTSIINDIAVTAAPLVLNGADTDTQWQGTAGTPADKISATNPLIVTTAASPYTFNCVISSGMDISGMAGGTCIAMTLGTATATAAITYIHPTKPILTLTVTGSGTITDLRLIGKAYGQSDTPYQSLASDATSIARYRKRHQDLENDYFRDASITAVVAARIIANQKAPTEYIPKFDIFPPVVNIQPGDRVNVTNQINGISQDYYVLGFGRTITMSESSADASMSLVLMEVPTA